MLSLAFFLALKGSELALQELWRLSYYNKYELKDIPASMMLGYDVHLPYCV